MELVTNHLPQHRGVEGAFGNEKDIFDAGRIEELSDAVRRRRDRGADSRAELRELRGGRLRAVAGDGVVVIKGVVDCGAVVGAKAVVVHPRPDGREDTARVVVAVMDARLVGERGPRQELRLALQEEHGVSVAAERQGEPGSVEAAADDDVGGWDGGLVGWWIGGLVDCRRGDRVALAHHPTAIAGDGRTPYCG